jgi:LPS-assembly protein
MRCRLLLFFLSCIYVDVSVADQALWNCAQNKDSKEWVCVGEKKPKAKTAEPIDSAQENPVKEIPSAPVEADDQSAGSGLAGKAPEGARAGTDRDENTQPVAVDPEGAKSQPSSAENAVLPAGTETDKDTRQVSAGSNAEPDKSGPKRSLQTEANRPGWTCGAKASDKSWDCKLVGADPKGQAQIIETSESGISLLTPAFDHNDEQTFSNLKSQLKYDPWQNCALPSGASHGFVSEKGLRTTSPLDINSDYAEIFDNEIYSYVGNVEMTRADQRSVSNKASYDTVSETLDLQGSVYYSEDELALHSESASLNLASDQARLRNALFISPATPLRGRANAIYRESATLSRYKDVAYTSCRPGNQDWVVHANELKLNKTTGQGAAKNAWVEFKGTPVFYSPYLSFPIDDRRLSGFLAPSFGRTQRGGLSLSTPYYWNIAPNFDATLSPRYLSNRGVILGGNFRYLTEMSNGNTSLEFMPHDNLRDNYRYLAAIRNSTQFTSHISSNLDLNKVSDKDYFSDLGNALSTSTYSSYLLSQANLGYANEGVSLKGHADSYQSIDKSITSVGMPYRRLPQVNLKLNHSFDFMPLNTLLDTEYVYFQHDARVNGQRTNVKPSISFPLQTASAFLTPKVSLQHTQYLLNNPKGGALLPTDSMSRTLPIFSTDTGLYMEKDVNFSNRSYLHTLEPRLFYLYIPKAEQGNMPIFDSALYDFSFNSMFLENRFSGTDRVQDANQLTAAVTSRLVDAKSGKEKLRFSIGQIAYFQDRQVTLNSIFNPANYPVYSPETNKFSNLVTELNAGLTDHISVSSGAQWSPYSNQVVRHNTMFHYINKPDANKPGEIFNVGYRYRKNTLIPIPVGTPAGTRPYDIFQSDVSVHWPIYNDWSAVGRWTYSLLNDSTQESFFGVEKENCCWTFRFIGRRWLNSISLNQNPNIQNPVAINATGVSQTGVFFEVELKGLTGIGEKLDNFFEQQIYGYRKSKND